MGKFEKGILIWMAILTTITTAMVVLPFVTQESPKLNVTYNETTRDYGNYIQETKINISNQGDYKATDITISITFPENTTIKYCDKYFNASFSQGILIGGGPDKYYCTYRFVSLDVNYVIPFTIRSHHPSFNMSNNVIIPPELIYLDCAEFDWFYWNR